MSAPDDLLAPLRLSDASARQMLGDLRLRLSAAAVQSGQLDVAYATMQSAVGLLMVAATPRGVVRVAFARDEAAADAAVAALVPRLGPRILRSDARLAEAMAQVGQYLGGERREFDMPLDLQLAAAPFRRDVLAVLAGIPYGTTASYGQVAQAAGRPRAVRAVGTACALNPLPLLIPCHRVVRSDGSAGSYAGGEAAKRTLLALESAA